MSTKETFKVAAVLAATLHVVGANAIYKAAECALADIQAEYAKTCAE